MSIVEWMIHMVFTTEGFVELAIESWPEWDLYIYIYTYIHIYIYIYGLTLYIAKGQNVNKKPTIANKIFYYFLPL